MAFSLVAYEGPRGHTPSSNLQGQLGQVSMICPSWCIRLLQRVWPLSMWLLSGPAWQLEALRKIPLPALVRLSSACIGCSRCRPRAPTETAATLHRCRDPASHSLSEPPVRSATIHNSCIDPS